MDILLYTHEGLLAHVLGFLRPKSLLVSRCVSHQFYSTGNEIISKSPDRFINYIHLIYKTHAQCIAALEYLLLSKGSPDNELKIAIESGAPKSLLVERINACRMYIIYKTIASESMYSDALMKLFMRSKISTQYDKIEFRCYNCIMLIYRILTKSLQVARVNPFNVLDVSSGDSEQYSELFNQLGIDYIPRDAFERTLRVLHYRINNLYYPGKNESGLYGKC